MIFIAIDNEMVMIFIIMVNGNGPPARIEISENKDGKLLSQLEWPNAGTVRTPPLTSCYPEQAQSCPFVNV